MEYLPGMSLEELVRKAEEMKQPGVDLKEALAKLAPV